jgi:hypothetical protein
MLTNPYSASNKRKIAIASRSGIPIADGGREVPRGQFRGRKSNEALVASNGEFNAGNKREVMQAISTLHRLFNSGEVTTSSAPQHQTLEVRAAQEKRLTEAWNDRSGQSWQALGRLCRAAV